MSNIVFFNKTVRGHLHKLRDIPCEDYSGSFSDAEGKYYIAVIADGHGDKSCFRSQKGSEVAVATAIEQLQDIAEAALNEDVEKASLPLLEQLRYPKGVQIIIRGLTDRIIAKWYNTVREDLSANPPTEEEYQLAGKRADSYRAGEHLEHIYGTTLIAALWVSDYLILLQQGDGRCDVFYEDGSIDQPIPWDIRCHENVTTSMCDHDVDTSFRHCVIDMSKKKVVACFLGSDGVEDSFPDPEESQAGTHYFYQKLAVVTEGMGKTDIESYLESFLPGFSAAGSGDDVSVAGLMNSDAIKTLLPEYGVAIRAYEVADRLRSVEAKLVSKQRKHSVLQRKFVEAQEETQKCEQAVTMCQARIERLSAELEQLRVQQDAAFSEMQAENEEVGKAREYLDEQENSDGFKTLLRFAAEGFGLFRTRIEDAFKAKEKAYEQLSSKVSAKASELETEEHEQSRLIAALEESRERLAQAQAAFEEYDAEYQRLFAEKQSLLAVVPEDPS